MRNRSVVAVVSLVTFLLLASGSATMETSLGAQAAGDVLQTEVQDSPKPSEQPLIAITEPASALLLGLALLAGGAAVRRRRRPL